MEAANGTTEHLLPGFKPFIECLVGEPRSLRSELLRASIRPLLGLWRGLKHH